MVCGETAVRQEALLSLFNRPVNWGYFNALSALKRTEADGLWPVSGSLQIELPKHLQRTLEVKWFPGGSNHQLPVPWSPISLLIISTSLPLLKRPTQHQGVNPRWRSVCHVYSVPRLGGLERSSQVQSTCGSCTGPGVVISKGDLIPSPDLHRHQAHMCTQTQRQDIHTRKTK